MIYLGQKIVKYYHFYVQIKIFQAEIKFIACKYGSKIYILV